MTHDKAIDMAIDRLYSTRVLPFTIADVLAEVAFILNKKGKVRMFLYDRKADAYRPIQYVIKERLEARGLQPLPEETSQ